MPGSDRYPSPRESPQEVIRVLWPSSIPRTTFMKWGTSLRKESRALVQVSPRGLEFHSGHVIWSILETSVSMRKLSLYVVLFRSASFLVTCPLPSHVWHLGKDT